MTCENIIAKKDFVSKSAQIKLVCTERKLILC